MATIGMKHPVWAPIESETPGSPIVYGEGVVLGEAVSASVSWRRADAKQYGDDVQTEGDNSILGGNISVETTYVPYEAAQKVWGLVKRTVNGKGTYTTTGESAPYGGFGWVDTLRIHGVDSFVVNWVYKVQLGRDAKNAATKAESLNFQNTTQQGNVMAVQTDETMKDQYFDEIPCETLTEALALLNSLAHIHAAGTASTEGAD